jgi:hypothetical protein
MRECRQGMSRDGFAQAHNAESLCGTVSADMLNRYAGAKVRTSPIVLYFNDLLVIFQPKQGMKPDF